MDSRIAVANPADWADLKWLAEGAFKLGSGANHHSGDVIGGSRTTHIERADVNDAISKFEFDPTNAADVLAARAYVWADHFAPRNYSMCRRADRNTKPCPSRSWRSSSPDRARSISPCRATAQSSRYIDAAVEDGMQDGLISESRARPANLPAALQTTIATARAALNLKTNDQMRAHHLIPANVWGEQLRSCSACQSGRMAAGFARPISLRCRPMQRPRRTWLQTKVFVLPIHNSSHPNYDMVVRGVITMEKAKYGNGTPTPVQARAIFEASAMEMEGSIMTGRWMPKLR